MENIVITWRELLIVVFLILGVYAAEVLLLTRSGKSAGRRAGNVERDRDRDLLSLDAEISSLHLRVDKLQDEVEQLKSGHHAHAGVARPYNDAVKMAGEGADVDQLAADCGISRAEAELIVAVNRLGHQKSLP